MMYGYTTPFELIEDFPTELGIPVLRDYIFVPWFRVKGSVYECYHLCSAGGS